MGQRGNLFSSRPTPAVTFRAGKMHKTGTTVTADTRKGQVSIIGDQSYINFQWQDRGTGAVEDDLMVFKDEAEYFRVEKCTTGRVYVLRFKEGKGNNALERFFWMQEPSEEKDDEYCRLINHYIKNPMQCGPGGSSTDSTAAHNQSMLEQLLNNRGSGAPGMGVSHPSGQPSNSPVTLSSLRSALDNLSGGGQSGASGGAPPVDVSLTDLFSQENIRNILSADPASFEQNLSDFFPEGIDTSVAEEVRTAQFRQALEMLQAALSDPQARNEIIQAFQLPQSTGGSGGGASQLIHSILAWHEEKKKK